MVWCGLSVGRLFLKFDQHYLLRLALNQSPTLSGGFSHATALLAIAAADYKNVRKKKKKKKRYPQHLAQALK